MNKQLREHERYAQMERDFPDTTFQTSKEALQEAIQLMSSVLSQPRFKVKGEIYLMMRRDVPYLLEQVKDNRLCLINRWYKPVGVHHKTHMVDYGLYPHLTIHLDSADLNKVIYNKNNYLFDDGCPPWSDRQSATRYLERIKLIYRAI